MYVSDIIKLMDGLASTVSNWFVLLIICTISSNISIIWQTCIPFILAALVLQNLNYQPMPVMPLNLTMTLRNFLCLLYYVFVLLCLEWLQGKFSAWWLPNLHFEVWIFWWFVLLRHTVVLAISTLVYCWYQLRNLPCVFVDWCQFSMA